MELKDTILQHYREQTSDVIADVRQDALNTFNQIGFPTIKHEEWKYTNLKQSLTKPYAIQPAATLSKAAIQEVLDTLPKGIFLVFVNGIFQPELSDKNLQGAEVNSFAEKVDVVQRYFGKNLPFTDSMQSLNIAFAQQGTFIRIPKNVSIEAPLFCVFLTDTQTENVFVQPSLFILLEDGAQATIAESYHTIGTNTSFTNLFSHILLQKDAYLDAYKIQNDVVSAVQINTTQLVHESKCTSHTTTITLGGGITRNNLSISLQSEHNEAYLNGLYVTQGTMHVDNHTLVDHAMPNCYSNELYKGILNDTSSGVFNGKIWVRKDAQKTNAFQSNKNVLMSKEASVNTKPQLEIFADDVKCSHGATTGQLDEQALYYLRARGIGEESAKKLLVHAFAFDVVDKIKNSVIKEYLIEALEAKL
ncbi:MAG: Fe-S cluster assembly protein SufD [Cytophagaceae bacterium]|jgi:Fe-S cluster assembly protein SufD|nr:Fe-S cluster assembly protein SufD [Cytophagaceae bacterium]